MSSSTADLLLTPLHKFHAEHGASFVDFAGWQMPIRYGSIHEEHRQVRTSGGLFDVSHMGRIRLKGLHARRLLERVLTRRISDMKPLRCRYSLVCNEQGGTLDDVIVYRFESDWLVVCNASNRVAILEHLQRHGAGKSVTIEDQTTTTAMVALQGPAVMDMIERFSKEVPTLRRYAFCIKNLMILKLTISRTGYTGEDGVELIMPASAVSMAMKLLYRGDDDASGAEIRPAGLGARDTLRMEAGMPLYGHELDATIDPISAGLGFAVSLDKDEHEDGEPFIGQDALKRIEKNGPANRLVGLKLEGRRTARQGMVVLCGDHAVGRVTSGCLSPTLGHPIAMAYVEADQSQADTQLRVDLGKHVDEAQVVSLPFYRRR
jgi:aminomethyltransferase